MSVFYTKTIIVTVTDAKGYYCRRTDDCGVHYGECPAEEPATQLTDLEAVHAVIQANCLKGFGYNTDIDDRRHSISATMDDLDFHCWTEKNFKKLEVETKIKVIDDSDMTLEKLFKHVPLNEAMTYLRDRCV